MSKYHISVMLNEAISYLNVQPGHWYIDCNLGGGGHTEEILKKGGKVLGIDLDPDAIKEVAKNHGLEVIKNDGYLFAQSENLILFQSNFSQISHISLISHISPISGVLFDLGASSHQFDNPEKGFSFNKNAPLDMRMNSGFGVTATDLLNALSESELAKMFWEYGEESLSKPIAKKIVEYRKNKKIETTFELVQIITSIKHTDRKKIHPATKIFQALRIAVNEELTNLEEALPQALEILQPGGRLVVISFHSLEDRIVKTFMKNEEKKCRVTILTQKPIKTGKEEIQRNIRSRSANLRATEKL